MRALRASSRGLFGARFLDMKILVTGAGGQVGTDLLPLLAAKGHEVFAFDLAKAPEPVPGGGRWIQGDITVEEEVLDAVKSSKADSIFHLAAILSATGEKIPFRAWRVNLEGTRNVLEAARAFGTKQVIFASTIAAFGPGLPDPVGNDVSMRPTTMYGVTKVAGELLGEYYATKFGIDFRGVRFPGLISAVEPGGGTSDYVNYMYFDGLRKRAYEAFVSAQTRIPLMYMPDALRALVELSEAPAGRLRHRMYNIAAMSPRADEIASTVAKALGNGAKFTFKSDPRRQAIVDSWPRALDDSVAAAEWGWKAQWTLDRMTVDLIEKIRALDAGDAKPAVSSTGTAPAAVSKSDPKPALKPLPPVRPSTPPPSKPAAAAGEKSKREARDRAARAPAANGKRMEPPTP